MNKYSKIALILSASILYLGFAKGVADFFRADRLNSIAKDQLVEGSITEAARSANKAVDFNPLEPSFHRTKATIYLSATVSDELTPSEKATLKQVALEELDQAYKLQPYNLVNVKNLVPLYYFLSLENATDTENISFDEDSRQRTLSFYNEVQDMAPTDASFYLLLGKHYKMLGDAQNAKTLLQMAVELKPDLVEAVELQKII